jgi:NAD(P)-dependent dehydrogenase (short-subunit alcohol dehydrogenase family)
MADLSGQVALVTGANRGIGREIASALAAAGAVVIAGARNPDTLSDLIASFPEGRIEAVVLDVTNDAQVRSAIDGAVESHGHLDLLVNNAGIGGGAELPWETPIEKTGELVVALASGKADVLNGRFIHATDDLDDLIAHADEIIENDLQILGMRFYESD